MQPESQPNAEAAGELAEGPTYDRTWVGPDLILVSDIKIIGAAVALAQAPSLGGEERRRSTIPLG